MHVYVFLAVLLLRWMQTVEVVQGPVRNYRGRSRDVIDVNSWPNLVTLWAGYMRLEQSLKWWQLTYRFEI